MDTRDNVNLDVKYLEVVTCTSEELNGIRKPVNGRLYHTSDTNEFWFDWGNKRHKLDVFKTDGPASDKIITKTELSNWLKENDYITGLSLTDAVIGVIGHPVEELITMNALENYASNNLLTKSELGLLEEPLNVIEDVNSLKETDSRLYELLNRLSGDIAEVRVTAESKLSGGDLDTELNEYLKKSLAESMYLTKEEAGTVYIDEGEFVERVRDFVSGRRLSESLEPYQKKSDADSKYETKTGADEKFVRKTDASRTYATKSEVSGNYATKSGVEEKLGDYARKSDLTGLVTKTAAESSYAKKTELQKYQTKSEASSTFAKKTDVNDTFLKKADALKTYATRNEVSTKYETKESVDEKLKGYARKSDQTGLLSKTDADSTYARKAELSKYQTKSEAASEFAKKTEVTDNFLKKSDASKTYVTKGDVSAKYETKDGVDGKLKDYAKKSDLTGLVTKTAADSSYARKTDLTKYPTKSEIGDTLGAFAKMVWIDQYYMRKDRLQSELSKYPTKDDLDSNLTPYATKSSVDEKVKAVEKKVAETGNRLSGYATKSQLEGYLKKGEAQSYPTRAEMERKLSEYAKKSDVPTGSTGPTGNFVTKEQLSKYPTAAQVSEKYVKKSDLSGYTRRNEMDSTLDSFAKKMWVDEYYMRKFKLTDYMKSDDIYRLFLEKGVIEKTYLTKKDAEKTYAKIGDVIVPILDEYLKKSEAESFSKKMWVDEYYMRKGEIDGIKNATVLSTEFKTESELREHESNLRQGFYYLMEDRELFLVLDDKNGNKIFVNITNIETEAVLYFGGDDTDW